MVRLLAPFARVLPCDLCGGQRFDLVSERDRRGGELRTVICHDCGLVAHAEVPTEDELTAYYQRQYRQDYHGEYVPSPHRVVREWNRGWSLLRLLSPYVTPADRIIEIGCGIGCTVKQFECAGLDACGIEPGEGFRRFAVESLRARVVGGELNSLAADPEYDVVLLVHVLEHLRSPTQTLSRIRRMLRAGGRLFVDVPNAGAPHAAPGKMFHFAHIYNFTRDTLGMVARKTGFRVVRWLSAPGDKNLRVMLACDPDGQWQLQADSYGRVLRALTGHTTASYHLRWRYLRDRVRTMIGHPCDHVMARRRVERILRFCHSRQAA
ncbi:MAG: methyltransferase domain-containing protein [Planctomycetes bacterium]|nr:methyltransferase domain-containing protein [Planctomycetota bacterium]